MIEGLSHITFIVRDLKRASDFLTNIFEAKEIYQSGDQKFSMAKEKYFLINGLWLAIMEGHSLSEKTYNHVAFKIPGSEFEKYKERVLSSGVEILEDRDRINGEGKSLYFYDHDNHLFELHTGTVDQRLESYKQKMKK